MGFAVLIGTLGYALFLDMLSRFPKVQLGSGGFSVTEVGLVSGALIEFIAAITFWLYARGTKQFGAFHICLERTHRYLIAYKIAETIGEKRKDETLYDLVCIMAHAPMISASDVDPVSTSRRPSKPTQAPVISAEVNQL